MQNTAQESIKIVTDSALKPLLKSLGYKKKGKTWNKPEGELIKVVNVQLSQSNSTDRAKFTVNLGIYHSVLRRERDWFRVDESNVKEYQCALRQRLGQLSHQSDFWWTIKAGEETETVLADVSIKFAKFALPWLESFKSLEDIYNYFVNRQMYFDAAVAAYILEKDSLAFYLHKTKEDANPYFLKTVERWMAIRNLN